MKTINSIIVFGSNKYFLAMLRGYCHASHITLAIAGFNLKEINEIESLKPDIAIIPLRFLNSEFNRSEADLFMQLAQNIKMKVCGLFENSLNITSTKLLSLVDVIIHDPFDISEIDGFIKKNYELAHSFVEKRFNKERRATMERRNGAFKHSSINTDRPTENRRSELRSFRIDRPNKQVFINEHKVDLTRKEFELVELLASDNRRIFTTDEILSYLWPENSRATKSDLYQYMHLLRKKIETDPNNPQLVMNIKGFGYRLSNYDHCEGDRAQNPLFSELKSQSSSDIYFVDAQYGNAQNSLTK